MSQQPGTTEVDRVLLSETKKYIDQHLDPSTGMILDETGKLNVRSTAVSALLWAELGHAQLATSAIKAVLETQTLAVDDSELGNFPYYRSEPPVDSNWSAFIGSYQYKRVSCPSTCVWDLFR
jgi:hypothetical protein